MAYAPQGATPSEDKVDEPQLAPRHSLTSLDHTTTKNPADVSASPSGTATPAGAHLDYDTEGRKLYGGVSIIPMWKTYILLFGLTVMTGANSAAIQSMNVAVGFIAQALLFEPQQVQWIVSAYTLSSGCLLLLFIPLCIQFGNREIFWFASVVYTAGAIGCACAQSPVAFIALRVVMGIGACSGIPSGFGIIANTLPVIEHNAFRSLALGAYAAGAPLGSAMGTIIGGLPTGLSAIKWRGIFAVLAGIGGLVILTTSWTSPPNPKSRVPGGPDWTGTAIITAALTLFLFCLSQGPADGWNTPYIIALLTIGCLLFPVFVFYEIWVERRGWTPMLRMSNFRRGRFGLINFLGFFGFMSFAIWDYFAGLFYVQVHGLGAIQVMLRYLPQAIGGIVGAISANWLLRRVSTQIVFCLGAAFAASGATIFAVAHLQDTYWERAQFFAFFLSINGACYVYASSMLYSVSVVVPSEIGAAGGVFQIMTSLAPAFGNVIATIVQQNQFKKDPENIENVVTSFNHAFWVGAASGMFALVLAIPGLWGIGTLGKSGESARVEELVSHHQEKEVIGIHEKHRDAEAGPHH